METKHYFHELKDSNSQIFLSTLIVNHENQSPVLCTTFSNDGSTVFSGGGDKAVRMWNLGQVPTTPNAVPQQIGVHDSGVKSVGFLSRSQIIVSGGWDKRLKFWDARQQNPVCQLDLPGKCVDIDVNDNMMVVATTEKPILVYDVTSQPRELENFRKDSRSELPNTMCHLLSR